MSENLDKDLASLVDGYRAAMISFCQRIVQTPSLPGEEGEVAALIRGEMENLGYDEVWTDDCVELFAQPSPDSKIYAHLIVNAAGVQQDNLPAERPVIYEWTAATSRGADSWSVEVRIPLKDIGVQVPADGEVWRFNVCRSRLPQKEATCWSPRAAC